MNEVIANESTPVSNSEKSSGIHIHFRDGETFRITTQAYSGKLFAVREMDEKGILTAYDLKDPAPEDRKIIYIFSQQPLQHYAARGELQRGGDVDHAMRFTEEKRVVDLQREANLQKVDNDPDLCEMNPEELSNFIDAFVGQVSANNGVVEVYLPDGELSAFAEAAEASGEKGLGDFFRKTEAAIDFLPDGAPIPLDAGLNGIVLIDDEQPSMFPAA